MRLKRPKAIYTIVAAVALAATALAAPAAAQERIGIGWNVVADGHCGSMQRTLTADYERTSTALAVRGMLRTRPAGGDCRRDAHAYDVRLARYFEVGGALDATIEFAAAREAAAAPYVLAGDGGAILLRDDGEPLYATHLPTGAADTVVAAIGVSRQWGVLRLGTLINLAPVDWAHHAPGRTARVTWDVEHRGVWVAGSVDRGAAGFGQLGTGYRYRLAGSRLDVGAGVTWRWGLAAVDVDAPATQTVAGTPFALAGPPQDHSIVTAVTVGYRLGG